jgi:hypothetical protein
MDTYVSNVIGMYVCMYVCMYVMYTNLTSMAAHLWQKDF